MTRLGFVILALLAVLGSCPSHAGAPVSFPGSNYGPIPDGLAFAPGSYSAPRDITFTVTGLGGTVSTAAVRFSADHTWVGDLKVRLIAPDGRSHLLFERVGALGSTDGGWPSNLVAINTYNFGDAFTTNWWNAANLPDATNIPNTDARTVEAGGPDASPAVVTSLNARLAAAAPNRTWILRFEDGFTQDTGMVTAATLALSTTGMTQMVTTASDSGAGSLRAAMTSATSGDRITFDPVLFGTPQTIELLTLLPNINVSMAIEGPGANLLTVRRSDTAAEFRIFTVPGSGTNVAISGMTISNGSSGGNGGGIRSTGSLTLSRVVVSGNHASGGGGVFSNSDAFVFASSITGNTADVQGGGLSHEAGDGSVLRVVDSTISGNKAADHGGIIYYAFSGSSSVLEVSNSTIAYNSGTNSGGVSTIAEDPGTTTTTTLRNTIIANNSPNNVNTVSSAGGVATTVSSGYNLSDNWGALTLLSTDVTGDARLGPLAPQGGSTPTHLLLGGSAALDKGNRSGAASDQRNAPRAFDVASITNGSDSSDIGAVEMQAIIVTTASDTGAGSLREAITSANANGDGLDDIIFDSSVFATPQTIPLATVLPNIASAMTLSGPGAKQLSVRRNDAAANFQIFHALPNLSNVAFSGMTITNGVRGILSESELSLAAVALINNLYAAGTGGSGLAASGCNVFITSSTISGNMAASGGGVENNSSGGCVMRLINSTVSGNSASNVGGGILNLSSSGNSRLEVINSTFANNTAPFQGRTIAMQAIGIGSSTTTILRNSIIASNSPPNLSAQTSSGGGPAVFVSRGFNLASDNSSTFLNLPSDQNSANAGLEPLADNGGPTMTHALGLSDAIDGGNNGGSRVTSGQRGNGFARTVDLMQTNVPGGDGTDIGAYEAQTEPVTDRIFASGFQ
ncbi:MAG: choice-of-anchor Q domain-containing protein [Dokdonella sp.]